MKKIIYPLTLSTLLLTTAQAELPTSASIEAGSLGFGANASWQLNDKTALQTGWITGNTLKFFDNDYKKDNTDDVVFNLETDFNNPYVGVQLRPINNALTVNTGVMYMGNSSVKAVANPELQQSFVVDNDRYTTSSKNAQFDAEFKFKNRLAPYATIGLQSDNTKPYGVFAELGAVYTGGIKTDVKATGTFTDKNGNIVAKNSVEYAQFEEKIRQEIKDKIDRELKGNDKFYPIVKVGATARF